MATYSQAFERMDVTLARTREALAQEVRRGLARRPRSLAPWMFYDHRGSWLFECITTLEEYYPTRTERRILACNANAIIARVLAETSQPLRIVELGAGVASKTGILLKAAVEASSSVLYMPLDVSPDSVKVAYHSVKHSFPEVHVEPRVVNYVTKPPQLEEFPGSTLMLYLGSSIGNFSPKEARTILSSALSQMRTGDTFLLGVDLVKDEYKLLAAYDDRAGVTAEFNLNILERLNRELGANFRRDGFRHRVLWNAIESRIEMHLESKHEQHVSVAGAELSIQFAVGESIHTENSHKFTDESICALFRDSGFGISNAWKDERGDYAVVLAHPCGAASLPSDLVG